jgi:hypothetical protein
MCQFVSWIEHGGEVYYLKDSDLKPKKFNEYKKYNPRWYEDIMGHGAIRYFYPELKRGKERECTNFSTPNNFPVEIVKAIKEGKLSLIGIDINLLNSKGQSEYEKIEESARAEYEKIEELAWAEYEKIKESAWAEYEKIKESTWAEYEKIEELAWAEYKKSRKTEFWKLFAQEKYRNPNWV